MNAVLTALSAISQSNDPRLSGHRNNGLVRTTGSYVPGLEPTWDAAKAFLESLDWEEVPWDSLPEGAGIPVARYFRAAGTGIRNTMTVAEARRRGIVLECKVHKPAEDPEDPNPRGLGVFAEHRAADVQEETQETWIILGPSGDLIVPWTWHPGPPAVPVTKRHYPALDAGRWDAPELQQVNVHLQQ